ncbi:MAG: tetratricopeptide repeat protein [Nitrospirae bacterium]|nr:tetratricopeptide repeat protein [Nitrospirota bacterium]
MEIIKNKEVRSVTREILTFQERPQAASREYRWKAIREYEEFIKDNKKFRSKEMADSMHELANIYMKMEENTYMQRKGKYDHSRSRRLYDEILSSYPARPANEEILYQLARGYLDEGDWEDYVTMLDRIIKVYPDGSFAHEAYFRLGEYYYGHGQVPKSVHYYYQVLRKDDYNFYDKALYKLGWALFQGKDYESAADKFILLLDRRKVKLTPEGMEETGDISIIDRDMVWDSIRNIVLLFDYMGGADRIANYFKVRGEQSFEPYIYRKLGDIYLNTGRYKEAADIYQAFINTNPYHEDAPVFHSKIVEAYIRGNMLDLAFNARVRLIETYKEDTIWFKSNRRGAQKRARDIVQTNKPLVRNDLFQLAKYHYAKARASKKKEDIDEAIKWLNRFPYIFPEDAESIELSFILAEILFEMKYYDRAAIEYEKVAYEFSHSTFTTESGYGALLALEKIAKPGGEIRADNEYIQRFVESSKKFVENFPDDRRVPEVLLNGTEVSFHLGKFEDSRKMAQQLIRHNLATDKDKYTAQRYIADSFLKEEAYGKGEEEIKKAIALVPSSDKKDLPMLERALAASLYKQAEGLKSGGKIKEAAAAFRKVYDTSPDTDIAPTALYDSGVLYEQDKDYDNAINSFQLLFLKYPGSRYTPVAVSEWGEILESRGSLISAAQIYENASSALEEHSVRENMLYKAVTLYEKGGNVDTMYNNYYRHFERFQKEFPDSPRLIELTFKAAKGREAIKDTSTAKSLYERVIALHRRFGASATMDATVAAARSQLILADYKKRSYESVKILNPVEVNLKKKEGLLKEALADYTAAAKYRISDITAEATFRMGEMFEDHKDAIMTSERPTELTAGQLEEYNYLLEEQAYPFEEKAISIHESNVKRTVEEGIYNTWVKKSYERLASLVPAKYKRGEAGTPFTGDLSANIPDDPDIYNNRGMTFRENGEFRKAEEDYKRSIALKPEFSNAVLNLGILYELYLGRLSDALINYKEYVKLGGERKDVLSWIGMLEKRTGSK